MVTPSLPFAASSMPDHLFNEETSPNTKFCLKTFQISVLSGLQAQNANGENHGICMHSRLFPGIPWAGIRWKNLGAVGDVTCIWPWYLEPMGPYPVRYSLLKHWRNFLIHWKLFTGTKCWNAHEYESLGQTPWKQWCRVQLCYGLLFLRKVLKVKVKLVQLNLGNLQEGNWEDLSGSWFQCWTTLPLNSFVS